MADAEKQTLVEEGTQFKGTLSSSCSIMVRGKIEGDLNAPSLTVSPSGAVHGTVKVGSMRSEGELAGQFDADTIQLSGVVKDNTVIRAKSLSVKLEQTGDGKMQVTFGECALEVGDMPSREKDVAKGAPQPGKKGKGAPKDSEPPPDAGGAM
jgi:cytoskeletal protein CcmA (bactofilin family)